MEEEAEIYDRRPRTFMSANSEATSELGCYIQCRVQLEMSPVSAK